MFLKIIDMIIIYIYIWCSCTRWSKIAAHFPGRTDNEIKNYWNTRIKKKMKNNGLDPVTHKPLTQSNSHDFEDKNEETEHHRRHQETVSIPTLKDYDQQQQQHKTEGSPSNQESINNDSSYIKNLEMGLGSSLLFQNKDSLGNFSVDSYHNLIDNPFFWDCFTGLGDNFPLN